VGGLILLSILTCFIRCCCCGLECCCGCFRCCNSCCPSPRNKKDKPSKHLDPPYQPPAHNFNQGYQPNAPPVYTPGPPQFASFDVSKPVHEDSLPPMPSWDTAVSRKVENPDALQHDMEKDDVELAHMNGASPTSPGIGQRQPMLPPTGLESLTSPTSRTGSPFAPKPQYAAGVGQPGFIGRNSPAPSNQTPGAGLYGEQRRSPSNVDAYGRPMPQRNNMEAEGYRGSNIAYSPPPQQPAPTRGYGGGANGANNSYGAPQSAGGYGNSGNVGGGYRPAQSYGQESGVVGGGQRSPVHDNNGYGRSDSSFGRGQNTYDNNEYAPPARGYGQNGGNGGYSSPRPGQQQQQQSYQSRGPPPRTPNGAPQQEHWAVI
jgi:hypothetical protein